MFDLTRQKRNKTFGLQIILFLSLISLMMSGLLVKPAYAATIQAPAADPTISINDMTVVEGTGPIGSVTFTVTLSEASGNTITVVYATSPGTATGDGVDYVNTNGTLTFSPGQVSKPIMVYINADSVDEVDEIFYVDLSLPTNATLGDSQGVGTIDDDDGPNISINSPSITEGNSGSVYLNFQVNLSGTSVQTVYVDYNTFDGTATAGADYIANSGTLTFVPGDTAETITIEVLGDELDEANDTFNVILSNPMDGFITTGTGEGTITDDDALPVFSIAPITVTVVEGEGVTVNFTVTLTPVSGRETRVNYSTAAGSATAAQDFYAISATTLIFAEGETSKVITATLRNDDVDENPETFEVRLTNPVFATVATAPNNKAVVTIDDDDPEPTITIADPPIKTEGAAGTTTTIEFTVQLSHATSRGTTVYYTTSSGSDPGDATPGVDYVEKTGSVTIANNASSAKFTVTINGDALDELDEVFTVTLTSATYATIVDDTAIGMINDDDGPAISISDSFTLEGNSDYATAVFTVTLSASSPQTVTVNYRTGNGSASAPADYTAIPSTPPTTLVFAPGTTVNNIYVSIVGDTNDEVDETFNVILSSPVDSTIADTTGVGTIDDDDGPNISINDVTVVEGTTGSTINAVFNVSLSYKSKQVVTVHYVVLEDTAAAGADYIAASGVLTFTTSDILKTIAVEVKGDILDEIDETFSILLSDPYDAFITDDTGVGTIDDDDSPEIHIQDVSVVESDGVSVDAVFVINLTATSPQTITVDYATSNSTAIAGADYIAASGIVTFTPGTSTKTISVAVLGDLLDEDTEQFIVTLSNAVDGIIADSTAIGVIEDNDPTPSISIADVTKLEGNSGLVSNVITVTLSAASGKTVTVNYKTQDITAVAPGDYGEITSGSLTFSPGETIKTITVYVVGDTAGEFDETFSILLSNSTNATITDDTGIVTITNDDGLMMAINNVSVLEGDNGTVEFIFTVSLSAPSPETVTVNFATSDGTATESSGDYDAASGTITFDPYETQKTVTIIVHGDELGEPDENFLVILSGAVNATLLNDQGVGIILNDDGMFTYLPLLLR